MSEFSKGDTYNDDGTIVNAGGVPICRVAESIDTEWLLNLLNGESGQRERADRAEANADKAWTEALKEQSRAGMAEARVAKLEAAIQEKHVEVGKLWERVNEAEDSMAHRGRTIDRLWRKLGKTKRRLKAEKALTAALLKTRGVK